MPFISPAYLQYLEEQFAAQAGTSQQGGEPPPANLNDPFASNLPPGQGGAGSYPASGPTPGTAYPYPSPVGSATPSPTPITSGTPFGVEPPGLNEPNYGTPSTTATGGDVTGGPPYSNPTAGTEAPTETLFPPGYAPPATPADELPGPPTTAGLTPGSPNDQFPLPGQQGPGANILNTLGNLFRGIAGMFPGGHGGFGERMGYFPPGSTPTPGAFGIVNPSSPAGGGSFYGGTAGRDPFGIAGSTFGLGSGGGGTIEGMGGKLAWHERMPQFGGRTLAQVARENPELLPGLANMGRNNEGSPAQNVGAGKVLPSAV